MTTLTIRGLDDRIHQRIRIQAAQHGRSMEAEVRAILRKLFAPLANKTGLGSRIHARFADLGGVELELPSRRSIPRAAEFDQ